MLWKGLTAGVSSKQSNFCFGSNCFYLFVSWNQKTFFLVCFGVSDRYRNNQNKQNFVETNRKNLHKTFSIRGSSKSLIFFLGSNQNKLEINLFWLFFDLLFRETQKNFFGLFRCFGPVLKQPKQTQLMVWGLKKVDILTNLLLFRLAFVCFGCFKTPKLPVSILKRNSQNKCPDSDSAKTSFG